MKCSGEGNKATVHHSWLWDLLSKGAASAGEGIRIKAFIFQTLVNACLRLQDFNVHILSLMYFAIRKVKVSELLFCYGTISTRSMGQILTGDGSSVNESCESCRCISSAHLLHCSVAWEDNQPDW